MNRIKIGKNLKNFRKELKLTQEKFAKPLGIKGAYISDIEKGKSSPSESVLILMEINYRLNRKWLLTGEGEPYIKDREASQDASLGLAAVTKEQAAAIRAGVTLEEIIQVFAQGDARINRIISILLSALADAPKKKGENQAPKESNQKLQEKNKKLEDEIKKLKKLLYEAAADFSGLVEAIKKIAENDSPPNALERRQSMMDLAKLIEQSLEKLNHRGSSEIVLEDESLRIPEQ